MPRLTGPNESKPAKATRRRAATPATSEDTVHVVTQEDIERNGLEGDVVPGDTITIPAEAIVDRADVDPADLEDAELAVSTEPAKKSAVDVVEDGRYIRTYSKELHGPDFAALAKMFADQKESRQVVPSSSIKMVTVAYRIEERDENGKKTGAYKQMERRFTNKEDALAFNNEVHGTVLVA